MLGETISHYKILEKLGQGGMGEVYRARDTRLRRDVALKVLPSAFANNPERISRFAREARVLASLSHPNIAAIHGFEEASGYHVLVLELVEGQNLAQRLSTSRLSHEEALHVATEVAKGLESAHQKGIAHRDLKPANIQLGHDNTVKILDFGLARAFEEPAPTQENLANSPTVTSDHTIAGTILGTAAYMSPEQVRGQEIDARTDIWSFGCVLYEMLCGRATVGGSTTQDVLAAILEHDPDWDALPRDLSPIVRRLLERCLRKDLSRRLHSISDVRIELEELSESVDLVSPTRSDRSRALVLALAVLAAFGLGSVLTKLISSPEPQPTPESAGRTSRYSLATATPIVPDPAASSVVISPDGDFIAYVALGSNEPRKGLVDQVSHTMLFVRSVNDFDATVIDGTVGASCPFISPDGQWIGFYDTNELTMKKVARNGGAPVVLAKGEFTGVRGAHWTTDGKIYFGGGGAKGLWVVDESGGEARALTVPDHENGEKTHRFPSVLPDNRHIVFTLGKNDIATYDDSIIALYSIETGEIRVLVEGGTDPTYVASGHIVFGRAGDLLAVPFDAESLQVTGSPHPVLTGVISSSGYGTTHYTVSNQGTLVYVPGGPEYYYSKVYALDLDGSIEPYDIRSGTWGDVSVAPGGRRVVMSDLGASAHLWLYEIDRGILTRLTQAWDNFTPVWHPDGRHIAFGSNLDGNRAVYKMAVDGSGQPEHLVAHAYQAFPGSWSPNGDKLGYAAEFTGRGSDIRILDTETGEDQVAVQTPAREYFASISPDGNYLAYVSNESGQPEIYVQTLPVTGRRWRLSEAGGDSPRWAPDGKSIYFWSRQDLMVVPITTEPEFTPRRAEYVLTSEIEDMQGYDIFPDGQRFVVIGRLDAGERRAPVLASGGHRRRFASRLPDIRVVLNWFQELP